MLCGRCFLVFSNYKIISQCRVLHFKRRSQLYTLPHLTLGSGLTGIVPATGSLFLHFGSKDAVPECTLWSWAEHVSMCSQIQHIFQNLGRVLNISWTEQIMRRIIILSSSLHVVQRISPNKIHLSTQSLSDATFVLFCQISEVLFVNGPHWSHLFNNFSARQSHCMELYMCLKLSRHAYFIRYQHLYMTIVKHQLQEPCTVL